MGPSPSKPTTDDTNLETFSLLWLDSDVNTSAENIEAQDKLRTIINHLKTFDNDKQCEEYIQDLSENDRIVLISSGRLGREFVPRVHHLRQIFSIYIYCKDKERHKEWSNGFIKANIIFILIIIFIYGIF
jgi:plasmid stabilization system protein ParE